MWVGGVIERGAWLFGAEASIRRDGMWGEGMVGWARAALLLLGYDGVSEVIGFPCCCLSDASVESSELWTWSIGLLTLVIKSA